MDEAREEIRAAGGDVVAVFQYRAQPTRNFCRQRGVALDCFGDPEREAYHGVGLERGSVGQFLGPRVMPGYLKSIAKGNLPGVPKGDTAQMPGTFVVGRGGRVALAHYNETSADNPPMASVLDAVRSSASA